MTIVQRFISGSYTVSRSRAGSYVTGRYVPGVIDTITIPGSLQPTNARELKLPEEGGRLKQYFKFYTDDQTFTIITSGLNRADVITIDGDTYKVWSVEPWRGFSMQYYMAILWREPENA